MKSHTLTVDKDTANKMTDTLKQKTKEKAVTVPEYIMHFGFNIPPFENVPDPKFFFDQGDYARVHNRIKDSLRLGRGLMAVTGSIGSGKTTLSQMILSELSSDIRLIWMAEPPGSSVNLFLFIAHELGLKLSSTEKTFILRDIRSAISKLNSEGGKCVVIIDESHLMSDDVINGIRLLNNLEEGSTKFMHILLLGQKEIMEIINRPEMEAFKQRIAALEIIGKMNAGRIRQYISHRIKVAGGQPSIFTSTGWEAILLASGTLGVPRIINSLCDTSLHVAFDRKKTLVDAHDVYAAAEGMRLGKEVFHYIVKLKNMEERKEAQSPWEKGSIKESNTRGKVPIQSFSKESDRTAMLNRNRQSETFQLVKKGSKIDSHLSGTDQKRRKLQILFLLVSMASLILSIFFYCQKSGSTDSISCLQRLIGF